MKLSPLRHLDDALSDLVAQGRLRERAVATAGAAISASARPAPLDLCSNDYLGYAHSGRLTAAIRSAAARGVAAGAAASRLVTGDAPEHHLLEDEIAAWLRSEASLVFTSGYAANVGTIAALALAGDHIISDALNHASIVDGCRLARARVTVVPHLDLPEVRRALAEPALGRRWVITESYFSMDADSPDLCALRALCDEADAALIVDEAHALGVYGPEGRGLCAAVGVVPDVLIGTLGKAAAGQGAFAAGSQALGRWLWNRARSFVYSTGLSPLLAAVATESVRLMRRDETGRTALHANAAALRAGLRRLGLAALGEGPIVPVVLGSEQRALWWSREMRLRGMIVQAIRPPTVPAGASRLRLTARADWATSELNRALAALREVAASDQARGDV